MEFFPDWMYISAEGQYYRPRKYDLSGYGIIQFDSKTAHISQMKRSPKLVAVHNFDDFVLVRTELAATWLVVVIPEELRSIRKISERIASGESAIIPLDDGTFCGFVIDRATRVFKLPENPVKDIIFSHGGKRYKMLEGMSAYFVEGAVVGIGEDNYPFSIYPETETDALLQIDYTRGTTVGLFNYYLVGDTVIRMRYIGQHVKNSCGHQVLRSIPIPATRRARASLLYDSWMYSIPSYTKNVLLPDIHRLADLYGRDFYRGHAASIQNSSVPNGLYFLISQAEIIRGGVHLTIGDSNENNFFIEISVESMTEWNQHIMNVLSVEFKKFDGNPVTFQIACVDDEPVVLMDGAKCTLPVEFGNFNERTTVVEQIDHTFIFSGFGRYNTTHNSPMFDNFPFEAIQYKNFVLCRDANYRLIQFDLYHPPQMRTKGALHSSREADSN